MPRPVRHPKTGVYLDRRRVLDRLRTLVGKREEKRSLGAKDPAEAKRRHIHVHAEVEAEWKALEAAPASRRLGGGQPRSSRVASA